MSVASALQPDDDVLSAGNFDFLQITNHRSHRIGHCQGTADAIIRRRTKTRHMRSATGW
jgi:hypothetical protein